MVIRGEDRRRTLNESRWKTSSMKLRNWSLVQDTMSSLSLQAEAAERMDQGVALAEMKPAEATSRRHTTCSLKAILHGREGTLGFERKRRQSEDLRLLVIDGSISWRHMIDK